MKVTVHRAGGESKKERGWSRAPHPHQLSVPGPRTGVPTPKPSAVPAVPTCVPALGVALARVAQPQLAPGVGKVDEEDELDEDEEEGADHTKVKPDLRGRENPVKSRENGNSARAGAHGSGDAGSGPGFNPVLRDNPAMQRTLGQLLT